MPWTHEQRMKRAIAGLKDNGRLEDENFHTHKRPRFFDKYAFRIGVALDFAQWVNFDSHCARLHAELDPKGAHIVAVKKTFDIYVYGNDPSILTWFRRHTSYRLTDLIITDPKYWDRPLPKTKRLSKFYNEYEYRIRMKSPYWGLEQENIDAMAELGMEHKLVVKRHKYADQRKGLVDPKTAAEGTFVYVKKQTEVLVLKLVFGDQVANVDQR